MSWKARRLSLARTICSGDGREGWRERADAIEMVVMLPSTTPISPKFPGPARQRGIYTLTFLRRARSSPITNSQPIEMIQVSVPLNGYLTTAYVSAIAN